MNLIKLIYKKTSDKISYLLEHEGFMKYFRNMGWMFFGNVTYLAISFFSVIFIARSLGPENYGQLSYAVSFVGIFGFIAGLGISNILFRELVRDPQNRNLYLGTSLKINIWSSLFAQALCIIFAFIFSNKDVSLWSIVILSFGPITSLFFIINTEFQAYVNTKKASIVFTLAHLLAAIIKVVLVYLGFGVIYMSAMVIFEYIITSIGLVYLRKKHIGSISEWKYDSDIAKKMLSDSWPLIIVSAFTLIYSRIDQVMIKHYIDAYSVGIYDAAVRLSELWYFIPTTIVASLFPAMVNAQKISDDELHHRIKKIGLFLFILSTTIAILVTVVAEPLVRIVYGTGFINSSIVLKIYVWSLVSTSMNILLNQYLITKNHRKMIVAISFLSVSTNIILNVILIPKYGIVGAAWATFVSYFVPLLVWVIFRKR